VKNEQESSVRRTRKFS